jgi:hypothetical protein
VSGINIVSFLNLDKEGECMLPHISENDFWALLGSLPVSEWLVTFLVSPRLSKFLPPEPGKSEMTLAFGLAARGCVWILSFVILRLIIHLLGSRTPIVALIGTILGIAIIASSLRLLRLVTGKGRVPDQSPGS